MNAQQRAIDALARDVARVESLRAVKDVQRGYAQHGQFGRWAAMAALFAGDATLRWGDETVTGRAAIEAWLAARAGAMNGRAPGSLHTEIIDEPLVHLSADGRTARGRWMSMRFLGDGRGTARVEGGIYENDYVLAGGRWLIATMRYHPRFEGDYHAGWTNAGGRDLALVPKHFTSDETGIPIPPPLGDPPPAGATLGELAGRIQRLNDEDAVRNLQHAYGYYVDRRMWSDVVDLFADDAIVTINGPDGSPDRYTGRAGVRRAMERMGPEGLSHGVLNDRPIFDLVVEVLPGGREAVGRGIELGLLGDATRREGFWEFCVFRSRFVKDGGLWKLREVALTPLLRATYADGWGHGGIAPPGAAPAEPAVPAFIDVARARPPAGGTAPDRTASDRTASDRTGPDRVGQHPHSTGPHSTGPDSADQGGSAGIDDLARRLARSLAYDGAENVSSAYGYYLDDFEWTEMAAIFAADGHKQSPFAGYYVGRDRIIGAAGANWGPPRELRAAVSYHWRTQPVIHVSHDGRSAHLRTRLFQPRTSKDPGSTPRTFYMGGLHSGMYPNDQAVLEDGVWRLWSLTIDEHYFETPDWKSGWAGATERAEGEPPAPPSRLLSVYPPDIPLTDLGRRQEGFRGGPGTPLRWPAILPMWFHYRNPVSGRAPERFWPDCVPCERAPETRMTEHGYQRPPNGPEIDGVELP